MENQESYNKFYSHFDLIVRRLAQLKPNLFSHIDLEDFIMFFEEPSLKGKNKGLPRVYNIFDHFLKNSQRKFSDESYVADICLALTYDKIRCANGLVTTTCRRMVAMYKESAHCKMAVVPYETLENELYIEGTEALLAAKDLEDTMFHKVFERGYLNTYFNGSDLIMLKEYLKSKRVSQTNIKNFTNNYTDYRNFSAKAYDTRLRNMYKAWAALSIVKFDIWDALEKYFGHDIFKSFQECTDFLNSLKPLKERKKYFKELKQKEAKTLTPEDKQLRYSTLKEYLVKKFGGSNVREVDGAFEVLVGKKWCLKYFLNGGYNNLKTGEKGSWLSLVQ